MVNSTICPECVRECGVNVTVNITRSWPLLCSDHRYEHFQFRSELNERLNKMMDDYEASIK